jgi:hypothetical protein
MRKLAAVMIAVGMAAFAVPSNAFAAGPARMTQGQTGTITGVAQGANKQALANYTVRVRNVQTGQIAGTTTSNGAGSFTVASLQPTNYVVEVVNAAGQVVGLSPSIAVAAGATVSVTIGAAAAAGAIAAGTAGGFSLLGLGTVASIAVVTAAGVAGVVAVVAVNNNASPSGL